MCHIWHNSYVAELYYKNTIYSVTAIWLLECDFTKFCNLSNIQPNSYIWQLCYVWRFTNFKNAPKHHESRLFTIEVTIYVKTAIYFFCIYTGNLIEKTVYGHFAIYGIFNGKKRNMQAYHHMKLKMFVEQETVYNYYPIYSRVAVYGSFDSWRERPVPGMLATKYYNPIESDKEVVWLYQNLFTWIFLPNLCLFIQKNGQYLRSLAKNIENKHKTI